MATETTGSGSAAAAPDAQLRGFMLADSVVFDQAEYDAYRAVVLPSVERHGGTFTIRGGRFERLEGSKEWHRLIGLAFPSFEAMQGWYRSDEYQALKAQRLKGARTEMVLVEETPSRGPAAAPATPPPADAPPAYVIASIDIHDLDGIRTYTERVAATHAGHGSRYLSRGGRVEVVEGAWQPPRLILIEFPSWDEARSWYFSDAYQELVRARQPYSTTDMVLVEGHRG
jgi:uncharacterized protein (DUF1330 family)